jgi:hypothetical protein
MVLRRPPEPARATGQVDSVGQAPITSAHCHAALAHNGTPSSSPAQQNRRLPLLVFDSPEPVKIDHADRFEFKMRTQIAVGVHYED